MSSNTLTIVLTAENMNVYRVRSIKLAKITLFVEGKPDQTLCRVHTCHFNPCH